MDNLNLKNNYEKPVIIFFSMIDYYYRIQRNQHICKLMAKRGYKIFYIRTKFKKNFEEKEICDNLIEINLNCDDKTCIYNSKLNKENIIDLINSINKLRKKYDFKYFISYIANPFWFQLLKYEKNTHLIYDCVDNHSEFWNISDIVLKSEKKLIEKANKLIFTSPILAKKHKIECYNLIRNGCDFEYFNNINNIKNNKKVICFYGAISDRIDVELLEKVIINFKDCIIYLIGFVYCNNKNKMNKIKRLNKYKNVKFFGEISYDKLHLYLKDINVGILPFEIIPLIDCTNPVKLYEMLGMGIPVVLTKMLDVISLKRDDLYYISFNHEDFIKNIEIALNENGEKYNERIIFAKNNSWNNRVDDFEKIINNII